METTPRKDQIVTSAAQRLRHDKSLIINKWLQESRREVPASRNKDTHIVLDELTHFIDELIKALDKKAEEGTTGEFRIAELHGQQRSQISDYTLTNVIHEYAILRRIILEFLDSSRELSIEELNTVNASVDIAIEASAQQFAAAETAKVRLALDQAERSNKDLEQFAAIVAHDLRAPLSTIGGFAAELEAENLLKSSPKASEYISYIKDAVKRMADLIEGVLNFARVNSESPLFEVADCNEALRAATQNLKGEITRVGGRITFNNLPIVRGKLALISQVFQNLIANALKYRRGPHPTITVTSRRINEHWEIAVRDNSKGFDPKNKEEIFRLYKTLDTGSGSGIGLATCRRVVELHGGKIWADSEPGKGSTFYFTLPAIQPNH